MALLLVAVLHFIEDADDPRAAVAELREALAPGSLLVLTHASYEGIPHFKDGAAGTVGVYKNIRNPLIMRSREEIGRFFEGYENVEPGLVPMPEWRPDVSQAPEQEDPYTFSGFAGVGARREHSARRPESRTRSPTAPRAGCADSPGSGAAPSSP